MLEIILTLSILINIFSWGAYYSRHEKHMKSLDKLEKARSLLSRVEAFCYQSLQNRRNGRVQALHDDIESYLDNE